MKKIALILLFLALLNGGTLGQSLPPEVIRYADTVLYNGKIVTVDSKFSIAQAVAVRDGKILAVGENREILRLAGPKTVKVDLRGKTVLPGLVDTHSHLMDYTLDHWGRKVSGLEEIGIKAGEYGVGTGEWGEVKSRTLDTIKRSVEKAGPGKWLQFGLPATVVKEGKLIDIRVAIRQGFLTREDLDRAAPKNPILLRAGPGGMYNSQAEAEFKQQYGDLGDDVTLPGGLIGAVPRRSIQSDLIVKDLAVLAELYKKEQQEWATYGITTWSSSVSGHNVIPAYKRLDEKGEMTIRFAYGVGIHTLSFQGANMLPAFSQIVEGKGSDFLWPIGFSTVNMDQSFPGMVSTAKAPQEIKAREFDFYIKPGPPGSAAGWRRGLLYGMIRRGLRFSNTHVAGDKTLDEVLDIIEKASQEAGLSPEQIRAKRHAVDHCAMNPRPDQHERLKRLGIIMSCSPKYIEDVAPGIVRDYGEEYLKWNVPVKSLVDAGVKTVIELDIHLTPQKNAFYYIQLLLTREVGGKVWGLQEKIDRAIALRMFTRWAAEYVLRENVLGSIEPGKWADLIVLDRDYMTIPEEEMNKTKVLLTIVGGKIVHEVPGLRTTQP